MAPVFSSFEDLPESIPALVLFAAERHGERLALDDGERKISYAELPSQMLQVTRALLAAGINKGDRVVIWAPNCVDWVLLALGLQAAGAVLVPLNTRMKGAEAADIVARSGARLAFVQGHFLGADYQAMLNEHRRRPGADGAAGRRASGHRTRAWPGFLPPPNRCRWTRRWPARSIAADDLSDLLFTSGTTGKSKGVMCAHGPALRAFNEYVRIIGLVPGDRYLIVNPFFHSFGYKAGWLTCLLGGATILPQPVFDADEVFRRVAEERITILPGPPTLYLSMLDHPDLPYMDLSSLRVAVTGASTIPPILIQRIRDELGCSVVTTAYGLTECGGLATICDPEDSRK